MPGKFGDDRINKKSSTFQMRSGNSPMFKMIGSSPHKSIVIGNIKKKIEERRLRRQGEQEQQDKKTYTPPPTSAALSWDEAQKRAIAEGHDLNELVKNRKANQKLINYYHGIGDKPVIESEIDIKTQEEITGGEEIKIKEVNKPDTKTKKTKKTKLTKAIDRVGESITEATTTGGKLDLFGEGKLFGKKSKTPRTKVIKGVEKEWRGGRWQTKKPAPTKNYQKGYYGA